MDWREIDLTTPEGLRALDREIAEREGWTDIEPITFWAETFYDTYEVHAFRGRPPGSSSNDSLLPAYSTDDNAALRLVSKLPVPAIFTLQCLGENKWRAWIDIGPDKRYADVATTPALAISIVWLDWQDGLLKSKEAVDGSS